MHTSHPFYRLMQSRFVLPVTLVIITFLGQTSSALAEQSKHQYTPKEQIIWSPSAKVAFDHSGKHATYHVQADGTTITKYNGSMMNITVARMGPDGKVETYCTGDAEIAKAWMAGEIETRVFKQPVREQ